ncbi:hypothetical protein AGMMS49944_03670 [Spirochaetia bacterium]|nr:hypothetical protein AGMMS49944_03670 [Spirochaetia bacterium]
MEQRIICLIDGGKPRILMACDKSDAGKMAAYYRGQHKGRQIRTYTPENYAAAKAEAYWWCRVEAALKNESGMEEPK